MASFQVGDTFLLGGLEGLDAKLHLFVVVCDAAGNPLTILAVPFNTVTSTTDTTLVLEPGEHPFINRKTAVSFDLLMEIEVDKLDKLEQLSALGQGSKFQRHSPTSDNLLQRIVDGALKSDLTPKGMVKILKARLGLP